MNKRNIKISITITILLCMNTLAIATGTLELVEPNKVDSPKCKLKGNMQVEYNTLPRNVDTIYDQFAKGIFYARLRSNTFYWDWDIETSKLQDNKAMGVGGSIIYKSGVFNGFSGTIGYYGSLNPDFIEKVILM